ncbi:MAG: hypothetical protein JWL86_3482 [Rhizobium sp.]|nr:hypothetical protein [Rhizobium sp.]
MHQMYIVVKIDGATQAENETAGGHRFRVDRRDDGVRFSRQE